MPTEQCQDAILAAAFDHAPSEAFVFDAVSHEISNANLRFCNNLRVDRDRLIGLSPVQFWHGLTEIGLDYLLEPLVSGKSDRIEHSAAFRRIDGSVYDVQISLLRIDAETPSILVLGLDLSQQRAAEIAALTAQTTLKNAIETLPDGFVLYDKDDRLVVCNDRYRETYALSADAMRPGAAFEDILRVGLQRGQYADAIGREEDWLADRLRWHEQADHAVEQELSDGRWLRVVERKTPEGGRVGFRVDITEIKQRQQLLERAAETDVLTNLTNRRGVSAYLSLIESQIGPGERLAVLHLDLDKFKAINDANGHEAGDFLLVTVANRLRGHVRSSDIVARNGGDEFLILIRTTRTDEELLDVADRIRADVGRPMTFKGKRCQIGVSIGVAVWQSDSSQPIEQVLADADIALYSGKRAGRNRVALFSPQMREVTVRNARLAQQIHVALNHDQILPHFQPQLDITGTRITGFEALARWDDPERGIISGGEFLAAAEETGLIADIDAAILIKSLSFVRTLTDAGFENASVSVNISSARLSDAGLADRIAKQVAAFGLKPSQIHIEILESTLLDDRSTAVVQTITSLSQKGFKIELDDFGTGHTAIASLRKFPVDRLKIDRSLVADIDKDHSTRLITNAILRLAEQLGIRVLAEGVETEGERATLEEIGCSDVQGFLFAKPMGADALLHWLRSRGLFKEKPPSASLFDPDVPRMMRVKSQRIKVSAERRARGGGGPSTLPNRST
ncbi:putative bifunctional diguanylate cyclase/phosphodiesterase [Flavimaricola marinus]|uniref:Cyclic di-GMP phosphodiesterase Gmr n=1 Tax=Flavimaricola marinus TaxID=1819565 RepID=A0A238LIA9_9RHOB|nr:EAL domain-containing protein [Flavimaricola marinus]SMY09135.1 Cyclic di-GMP phosphodiesterase Gmr [Flavimaricola marinus]